MEYGARPALGGNGERSFLFFSTAFALHAARPLAFPFGFGCYGIVGINIFDAAVSNYYDDTGHPTVLREYVADFVCIFHSASTIHLLPRKRFGPI